MPITSELQNAQKFRSAGFTERQAEVLAQTLEEAVQAVHADLKLFIGAKFEALELKLDARFAAMDARRAEDKADLMRAMIACTAIVVACMGIAVALIKYLPALH